MLYLVGSQALKHYGVNLGRKPIDIDIFSTLGHKIDLYKYTNRLKYTEKGEIRTFINDEGKSIYFDIFEGNLWDTDKLFLHIHGINEKLFVSKDKFLTVTIAPKEILYIMYRTTAEVYKDEKSVSDFEYVKKAWPDLQFRHELYQQRLKETQDYYDKTKKQFFEQHGLKQFIDHDKLHEMVTAAWTKRAPRYLSILDSKDSTKIDIKKFKDLSHAHKIMLLAEEICVLLFERFFIYKTVTEGFRDIYVKQFFNNSKHSVTTKLIHHVCEKGLKGEHPEIIKFAKNNIKEITDNVYQVKILLKQKSLPTWFLNELQDQREKYLTSKT